MQLAGQAALITGAAQGIGLAIARALASEGVAVTIADVQNAAGEDAALAIRTAGYRAAFVHADVSDEREIGDLVSTCLSAGGRLDILVNNAAPGRRQRAPNELQGVEKWDEDHDLMLRGYMLTTRAAIPHLAMTRGVVVNLSSVLARSVSHESCGYHVAKAGVEQMTRYFAYQLGPQGIRVNAVAPGVVDRDIGVKLTDDPVNRKVVEIAVPLRRAATATEIGRIVAFLCSSDAAYITGQTIVVDGGLSLGEPFGVGRRAVLGEQGSA